MNINSRREKKTSLSGLTQNQGILHISYDEVVERTFLINTFLYFFTNPLAFFSFMYSGLLVFFPMISWRQRRRRRRPRVFSSSSLCYSSSYVQNFMSKSGSLHVTVYFPIVIDICGIFRLCSISIGMSTVSTVQERCMVVTPSFEQEVLHLRGAVGKRTWLNHSRSSPTPPLMSGDDKQRYKRSCGPHIPKVARCL